MEHKNFLTYMAFPYRKPSIIKKIEVLDLSEAKQQAKELFAKSHETLQYSNFWFGDEKDDQQNSIIDFIDFNLNLEQAVDSLISEKTIIARLQKTVYDGQLSGYLNILNVNSSPIKSIKNKSTEGLLKYVGERYDAFYLLPKTI